MIDLTPLDVRNKRGDFKRQLRGYDPQEVDTFLELVAERLEELVRENMHFRDRAELLQQQVTSQGDREKAVQEALVTAQELRTEMKSQAERRSDLIIGEAQAEARRLLAEAEAEVRTRFRDAARLMERAQDALVELERRRTRFLKSFRQLLDREMDVVEVEENRPPLEERPVELDLGRGRMSDDGRGAPAEDAGSEDSPPMDTSLDALTAGYRSEGADLFREAAPPGPSGKGGEADLFSGAGDKDKDDEDARWG